MTPKQRYGANQTLKKERRMAQQKTFEQREAQQAEAEEILGIGIKLVRAFLEGKAEINVQKSPDGSLSIRLRKDS